MDCLDSFMIGFQGEFNESGFKFKARADVEKIDIHHGWKNKSTNDANQLAQILMLRFSDSYLRALPESSSVLDINTAISIIIDVETSHESVKSYWDSMVSSSRILKLLYLQGVIDNNKDLSALVSKKVKVDLTSTILRHVKYMSKVEHPYNNHGLQGMHAMVGMARLGFSEIDSDKVTNDLVTAFEQMFNSEGFYLENSSEYHFYSVQLLEKFVSSGWYEGTKLELLLDNAKTFYPILFASKGEVFSFGDTDRSLISKQVRKGVIKSTNNLGTELVVKPLTGLALSRYENGDSSDSVMLINMYHGRTHNHHDYMSFEWHSNNKWIVIDPGKFSYDSSPEKDWFLSDISHNTLSLSSLNHDYITSRKSISGYSVKDHHSLYSSVIDKNFIVERELIHKPNELTIKDQLVLHTTLSNTLKSSISIGFEFIDVDIISKYQVVFSDGVSRKLRVVSKHPIECFFGSKSPFAGWYAPQYKSLNPCWQVLVSLSGANIINSEIILSIEPLGEL